MAQRNNEKRTRILKASYDYFSRMTYDEVALSSIAEASGINKSLLQHYYGKKSDIIRTLLDEILSSSVSFMKTMENEDDDMFQFLSDFNMLFFKSASINGRLDRFITSSVRESESLSAMIDSICQWLRALCGENTFSFLRLKAAVSFSMAGSMHLYEHRDELGLDYHFICRNHIHSIMSILGFDHSDIETVLERTDDKLPSLPVEEYLEYCSSNIPWFTK